MTPEEHWQDINAAFKKDMEPLRPMSEGDVFDAEKNYAGGLAGSPIVKSPIAVIGINWGGKPKQWNDSALSLKDEPELLSSDPFPQSIHSLYNAAIEDDLASRSLLKSTFYSNRYLFKTSRTTVPEYKCLREHDNTTHSSLAALGRMLSIVQPQMALCFGVEPRVFILDGIAESLWIERADEYWFYQVKAQNRYIYRFTGLQVAVPSAESASPEMCCSLDLRHIWIFPHPSGDWSNGAFFNNTTGKKKGEPLLEALGKDLLNHAVPPGLGP